MDRQLFQDRFKIQKIDPDNKTPFRNVSRVHLSSYSQKQDRRAIEIDINIAIYPVSLSESFLIRVGNGSSLKSVYSQQELSRPSQRDSYEYVMYGVVFDIVQQKGDTVIYTSFGGLLMRVAGTQSGMAAFRKQGKDARVVLMMKRA